MLHAENLFEVVSCFTLYELDALLLTSRELSAHASKCAEKIPTWYFASVEITFWNDAATLKADRELLIYIGEKRNVVEVLDIALRNSFVGHLQLYCDSYRRVQPTDFHSLVPNNAALMVETLHLCPQDFHGATDLIDFLGRFRTIKALEMNNGSRMAWHGGRDNGMNFEPVVNYCRQRGIESVVINDQTFL